MEKIVQEYLDKVKPFLEGATKDELFKTSDELSKSPELRRRIEGEIRKSLPKGYSFDVDKFGIGHLAGPLHISKQI